MNYNHILCLILLLGLISCQDSNTNKNSSSMTQASFAAYEILKTEPHETPRKAQIKCYAYLTTDIASKDELSATLTKIYGNLQNYSDFKEFPSPTVIAIYLFTSQDKATNMPASWVAMLSKYPSDNQPKISFNNLQLKALKGSDGSEKSTDEKKYDEINEYLKERDTDLCLIYKTLYDLEGTTIKQADVKYPNFGMEHSEYQSKLYTQEKQKLFNKYNINDSLSSHITVLGMSYCK